MRLKMNNRYGDKKAKILTIIFLPGTSAVWGRTGSEPAEAEVATVCQQEHLALGKEQAASGS